jgi:hypothetical protein
VARNYSQHVVYSQYDGSLLVQHRRVGVTARAKRTDSDLGGELPEDDDLQALLGELGIDGGDEAGWELGEAGDEPLDDAGMDADADAQLRAQLRQTFAGDLDEQEMDGLEGALGAGGHCVPQQTIMPPAAAAATHAAQISAAASASACSFHFHHANDCSPMRS